MGAPESVPHRHRRAPSDADPDGINFHAEGVGGLGGGQRRDAPRVVFAVGHQDEYFAFRLQRAQMIQR